MSTIPILIINRDRLQTLERMVDTLHLLEYDNIYILDMGSTYLPLMEYYRTCKCNVVYLENNGYKSLWSTGVIDLFNQYDWIAISDSDLEFNPETPVGFIEELIVVAKDFRCDKVGLAIEYLDLTNEYLRDIVVPIEDRYWINRLNHPTHIVYDAPVDSTFCVIRPTKPFAYTALRVAGQFTCRHIDWYSNWYKLTEEEQYYFDHTDPSISTTCAHYNQWRTKH